MPLGSVRLLSETRLYPDGAVPWSWRLGLYQGGKLDTASHAAYRRMLQDTFLPSLAAYVERYLREGAPGSQEESYDTLKTYLMLYDAKHFSREGVWRWFQAHGADPVPGTGRDALRTLEAHFNALYERGWVEPAIPRNEALIARVRAAIGRDSLAARLYARLKREPVPDLKDFNIAERAGPSAMLVLERQARDVVARSLPHHADLALRWVRADGPVS